MSTIIKERTDIERATALRQARFDELLEEYGDYSSIPYDEVHLINEELRAVYCFSTSPTMPTMEVLKYYNIDRRIWNRFLDNFTDDTRIVAKKKRTDKYQSIIDWTKDHLFEQVTPQTIMDLADISYPTALKFINDRPDIFRKVKRGLYEVRDPQSDRKADKR